MQNTLFKAVLPADRSIIKPKCHRNVPGVYFFSAKPIRKRFSGNVISGLLGLKWWDWPENRIKQNIAAIQSSRIEDIGLFGRNKLIRGIWHGAFPAFFHCFMVLAGEIIYLVSARCMLSSFSVPLFLKKAHLHDGLF